MRLKRQFLVPICCGVAIFANGQVVESPWSLRPALFWDALPVGSGFTPINIEIENGVTGSPTNLGANLYPRELGGLDPVLSRPQFPVDALYTYLGFGSSALANNPLLNGPNVPRLFDWVKDTLQNTDYGSVQSGLAAGIVPGISGTTYDGILRGHWNGLRIVDGISNAEQDMFVQGGKEDDPSGWKIAPGSIGAPKYDITQGYIANTRFSTLDTANFPSGHVGILYLALERRSNVGTTVYDVEFNQLPPVSDYIPNRTEGDVLITLEANGSGSSGSCVPHIYVYRNNSYLNNEIFGTIPPARRPLAVINQVPTPSAPWGYVNERGVWTIGQIPSFSFIEAAIPVGVDFLQGINLCSGAAYVQIRSRSSVSTTGILKDATRYFRYQFNEPTAIPHGREHYQRVGTQWLPTDQVEYDGASSLDSFQGRNLNLFRWKFKVTDPRIGLAATAQGLRKIDDSTYELESTSGDPSSLGFSLPDDLEESTLDASLDVLDFTGCFSDGPGRKGFKLIKRANRPIYDISAYRENGSVTVEFTASGGHPPFDVRMKFKNADGTTAFEDLRIFTAEGTYLCVFPDSLLLDGVEVTVNDRVVADDDGGPKGYVPIVPKI